MAVVVILREDKRRQVSCNRKHRQRRLGRESGDSIVVAEEIVRVRFVRRRVRCRTDIRGDVIDDVVHPSRCNGIVRPDRLCRRR